MKSSYILKFHDDRILLLTKTGKICCFCLCGKVIYKRLLLFQNPGILCLFFLCRKMPENVRNDIYQIQKQLIKHSGVVSGVVRSITDFTWPQYDTIINFY